MLCEPIEEPGEAAFFFSRGPGTYRVPRTLHVTARAKLVAALAAAGKTSGVVLLRGGIERCRDDTDHEEIFRQESYFAQLLGVVEAGCWATIALPSAYTTLFIPNLHPSYAIWMGPIKSPAAFRTRYGVDACRFVDDVQAAVGAADGPVYVLSGTNTDSEVNIADVLPTADGVPPGAEVDTQTLYPIAADCRVLKSAEEVELMRYTAWVSSCAHANVMRDTRPGMLEYQLEALFLFHCAYHGGARHSAYTCICACGPDSAVLHYGHAGAPNERLLQPTDVALLDMGCEYHFFASDITCSFPVGGLYTPDQRMVHEAVLDAQYRILDAMRPGVSWSDMHTLMWRVILTHLTTAGLLVGEVDDMIAANLGYVFTPHGLGHLIGVDTHDVGGYLPHTPARSATPGLSKLRTARVLEAGMMLTVEPGCYFIDALLEPALEPGSPQNRFLVPDVLQRFRGTGGVRLEDVVVVTPDGVDNLTLCPRTVTEVEAVCRGGDWPPTADAAPWLQRRWYKLDKPTGTMVADKSVRVDSVSFTTDADF